MSLPCSPFAGLGVGEFAARFRRNEFSARTVTATLLAPSRCCSRGCAHSPSSPRSTKYSVACFPPSGSRLSGANGFWPTRTGGRRRRCPARAWLDLRADEYVRLAARQRALVRIMTERSRGIDAWITPTVPVTPMPCAEFHAVEGVGAWNRLNTRNTRPGNLFGQCGISLPIQHLGAALPVGLQLCGPPDGDARLLAVAAALEAIVGRSSLPRLEAFVTA